MEILTRELPLQTSGFNQIVDITTAVSKMLNDSEFVEGQLLLFVPGSTGGITTIEYEPGLVKDITEFMEAILPMNKRYHHDETWNDGNGYAHLRSSLIKPSLTVPFASRRMLLGTWQQIIFIDFDNRKRERHLIIQFTGMKK